MDDRSILAALLRGEPAAPDADWPALVSAAAAHGVLGLLADRLPPHAVESARPALAAQRLGQMRVLALQTEVLAALPCPVVLLKGPSLSERLYGDPFRRASRDLDILVDPADLDRVLSALKVMNFDELQPESQAYFRAHHHHLTLAREHTPPVEVHFRLLVGFGTALPAGEFLERSQPYRGERVRVLSPEDEYLYLAVHAAQHLCNRLIWLEDLRRLRETNPNLDGPRIERLARRLKVRKALAFTERVLEGQTGELEKYDRLERTGLSEPVRDLLAQMALCDTPVLATGYFQHHAGRLLRRRWHRYFPQAVPAHWAE